MGCCLFLYRLGIPRKQKVARWGIDEDALFLFLLPLYKQNARLSRKGRKFVRQMLQKDAVVRQKRAYVRSFCTFFRLLGSVSVKRFFLTNRSEDGIIEERNKFETRQKQITNKIPACHPERSRTFSERVARKKREAFSRCGISFKISVACQRNVTFTVESHPKSNPYPFVAFAPRFLLGSLPRAALSLTKTSTTCFAFRSE